MEQLIAESGQFVSRPNRGVVIEVYGGGISNTIRTCSEQFQFIIEMRNEDTDTANMDERRNGYEDNI